MRRAEGQDDLDYPLPGEPRPDEQADLAASADPGAGDLPPADGGLTTRQIAEATAQPAGGTDTATGPVAGETQTAAGPVAGETQTAAGPAVRGAETTAEPVAGRDAGEADADAPGPGASAQPAQLLAPDELQAILSRWREIQAGFVDEPRQAVQDADRLVADLMQRLARMFAAEREQLEARWSAGDSISTEDLRLGLQRYRSFFERLLAA